MCRSKQYSYKDIPWDMVFDGSAVTCNRCLNLIRNLVLRRNSDINVEDLSINESCHSFLDETSNWSIKVVAEAKEMANDPTWFCDHPPDETYFVTAILQGVKDLMDSISVPLQKKSRQPSQDQPSQDSFDVAATTAATTTPVETFMTEVFISEGTQVDILKIECGSQA